MKKKIGGAVLMVMLAACSGPMVQTWRDPAQHFEALHAYTWASVPGRLGPGVPQDPTLGARIQAAVDAELTAKGFSVGPASKADVLLEFDVSAEKKVDSDLKHYETAALMDLTYTLGSLDLTMRRPASPADQAAEGVVWKGSVQTEVDLARPLAERNATLQRAVHALLKQFPPK